MTVKQWLERQEQKRVDTWTRKEMGLIFRDDHIEDVRSGRLYPLAGARAVVSEAGNVDVVQRLTATRMVLFGVFALAVPKRKKIDARSIWLIVSGPGWEVQRQVPPQAVTVARKIAENINSL